MINVTLPDEKSNYVHRIGRVGRAERMGLAFSIVSAVPEKVSKASFYREAQYRSVSLSNGALLVWTLNYTLRVGSIHQRLGKKKNILGRSEEFGFLEYFPYLSSTLFSAALPTSSRALGGWI